MFATRKLNTDGSGMTMRRVEDDLRHLGVRSHGKVRSAEYVRSQIRCFGGDTATVRIDVGHCARYQPRR